MKNTGIVRRIDPLGRIVIPKELRKSTELAVQDPVEIFVDEESIIFKKYKANGACIVTGEILDNNVEYVPGLTLSPKGAKQLLKLLQKKE